MKKLLNRKNSDGFTLLELIVAVGVTLALVSGGLLAYSGLVKRAKEANVSNAADTVLKGAQTATIQGMPLENAEAEYNASTDAIKTRTYTADEQICTDAHWIEESDIASTKCAPLGESTTVIEQPIEVPQNNNHRLSFNLQLPQYTAASGRMTVSYKIINATTGEVLDESKASVPRASASSLGRKTALINSDFAPTDPRSNKYRIEVEIDGIKSATDVRAEKFTKADEGGWKANVCGWSIRNVADFRYQDALYCPYKDKD